MTFGQLLTFCLVLPATLQGQIQLPPVFGHNMVLQQGARNVLWGTGPAGKRVWIKYKDELWDGKADKAGHWRIELNFKSGKFSPDPETLSLIEGKKDQLPTLQLTNVALGKVWLFAGWESQGMPADINDKCQTPDQIRFTTIEDIPALTNSISDQIGSWDLFPRNKNDFQRFPKLSLHIGRALVKANTYVGIVQTTVASVEMGLLHSTSSEPIAPGLIDSIILDQEWRAATNGVWQFQTSRSRRLIEAKRQGQVIDIEPVTTYTHPWPWMRVEFDSKKPPASLVPFEGAIWPREH